MSRRVYLGHLPPDVTKRDVEKHFDGYGAITECRIMGGFGFLEFGSGQEAEDVIKNFNGKQLLGQEIIVEAAKDNSRKRDTFDSGERQYDPRDRDRRDDRSFRSRDNGGYDSRPAPPKAPPRGGRGVRVLVKGISPDVSWQDLKDFGREGGPVSFADVDRANPGVGILEYPSMADAQEAVSRLSTMDLRNSRPEVVIDEAPPPPRDAFPPRADDRRRDDFGGGGGGYRRERSPPPPRANFDDRRYDRRERSPPRREEGRREEYRGYERREEYPRRDRSPPRREEYRRDDFRDSGRDRYERAPDTRAAPLRGD